MDIYEQSVQLLLAQPQAQEWPELHQALERALLRRPVAWHFPVQACLAVGGPADLAIPAVSAITCAHMALLLIDDLLDEDPRGLHHKIGEGRAANLASALNALGLSIVIKAETCKERQRAAIRLNDMVMRTASGQDLDVRNPQTEQDYWKVTRAKSSPYFGTALYIGALFGNAELEVAEKLNEFGELYGEIMQIHDDLNDSLATPANVDWLQGRSPLPLLFAQVVAHPERERFVELRSQVEDPAALEEAQSILVRCGAISYSVNALMHRHKKAAELITTISLADADPLEILLEEAIAPVRHLFEKVGAEFSEMQI